MATTSDKKNVLPQEMIVCRLTEIRYKPEDDHTQGYGRRASQFNWQESGTFGSHKALYCSRQRSLSALREQVTQHLKNCGVDPKHFVFKYTWNPCTNLLSDVQEFWPLGGFEPGTAYTYVDPEADAG